MGVNGKDSAAQVRQLQQDNRHLRSLLEQQYNQMIKMADTIQMVHTARIREAAVEVQGDVANFKDDLDHMSRSMEGQQQTILRSRLPPADQAEQLRALEDRARKWAKRYLHKIKTVASKVELAAGIQPSPSLQSRVSSTSGKPSAVESPAARQSVTSTNRNTPGDRPSPAGVPSRRPTPRQPSSEAPAPLAATPIQESLSMASNASAPAQSPHAQGSLLPSPLTHRTTRGSSGSAPEVIIPSTNGVMSNGVVVPSAITTVKGSPAPQRASAPEVSLPAELVSADGVAEGVQLKHAQAARAGSTSMPGMQLSQGGSLHMRNNDMYNSLQSINTSEVDLAEDSLHQYVSGESRMSASTVSGVETQKRRSRGRTFINKLFNTTRK